MACQFMLGMLAPDFDARTTQGNIKLSGLKGKWVILFSHPADFTPVCTTEFIAFARSYEEFTKRNVQLILDRRRQHRYARDNRYYSDGQ